MKRSITIMFCLLLTILGCKKVPQQIEKEEAVIIEEKQQNPLIKSKSLSKELNRMKSNLDKKRKNGESYYFFIYLYKEKEKNILEIAISPFSPYFEENIDINYLCFGKHENDFYIIETKNDTKNNLGDFINIEYVDKNFDNLPIKKADGPADPSVYYYEIDKDGSLILIKSEFGIY